MEESLNDVLLAAGEMLAEAVRAGLVAHGAPGDLSVAVEDGRVVVSSRAKEVLHLELGRAGVAPVAPMETACRSVMPNLAALVAERVREWR